MCVLWVIVVLLVASVLLLLLVRLGDDTFTYDVSMIEGDREKGDDNFVISRKRGKRVEEVGRFALSISSLTHEHTTYDIGYRISQEF